jgi:hypothetical protein
MKGKVSSKIRKAAAGGSSKMKKGSKEGNSSSKQTGQAMMFNHALGQHILKNPLIVQALVDKVSCRSVNLARFYSPFRKFDRIFCVFQIVNFFHSVPTYRYHYTGPGMFVIVVAAAAPKIDRLCNTALRKYRYVPVTVSTYVSIL